MGAASCIVFWEGLEMQSPLCPGENGAWYFGSVLCNVGRILTDGETVVVTNRCLNVEFPI